MNKEKCEYKGKQKKYSRQYIVTILQKDSVAKEGKWN